jgi:replicative DNA helicase
LIIDDTANMSVAMIKTRARRIARKFGGIALIVIDYLQLMTSPGGKHNDNRVQELSEITRGLKILAKELDVPVIALSQLSRSVEQRDDKRPVLSDLRESGSIEQDADIVMFTYREEYYLEGRSPDKKLSGTASEQSMQNWQKRLDNVRNKADVIIAKNRHGKPETVHLSFTGEYYLFDNLNQYGVQPFADTNIEQQYTAPVDNNIQTVADINDIPDDMI